MIRKTFKHISMAACLLFTLNACQDLKFGDDFLEKAPSNDVDIDVIYSNAQYARTALWSAYQTLPYGLCTGDWAAFIKMGGADPLDCLTDLVYSNSWDSGYTGAAVYYRGLYSADYENDGYGSKYGYYHVPFWTGIRRAWLFIENVDRVPDMPENEKARLKAEAKVVIATHYTELLRYYGGMPIIDHAFKVNEDMNKERGTVMETLDFIVKLCNEAAAVLPWAMSAKENAEWEGRMTKASAMGLKARVLLFVASPLFNSATPYLEGEASTKGLTWIGGYKQELWQQALEAHKAFFDEMNKNGGYGLVQKADPRQAFRSGYLDRGTGETMIAFHFGYTAPGLWEQGWGYYEGAADFGTCCGTQELVDLYPMAEDGLPITESPLYNPKEPYKGRDPRLYETVVVNGDKYYNGTCDVYVGGRYHQEGGYGAFISGYRARKFVLDGGWAPIQDLPMEVQGKVVQWPYLRLPELYLGYAEALCQTGGDMNLAYECVNKVRDRVGVKGLKRGLNKEQFIDALLTERACEFAYEEVRWFDLVRYKRDDILRKEVHRVTITPDEKNPGLFNYENNTFKQDGPLKLWSEQGRWSNKWYLNAFPSKEINKAYGLIQNPGWE